MAISGSLGRRSGWLVESSGTKRTPAVERYAALLGGGLLTAYGLTRRSLGGGLILGLGAVLVLRGLIGRPPLVRRVGEGRISWVPRVERASARRSVTILKGAGELYDRWRLIEDLAARLSHVRSIRDVGGGVYRWVATDPRGRTVEWDAAMTWNDEERRISWRTVEGAPITHLGFAVFREAPMDRGAEVLVSLQYEMRSTFLGTAIPRAYLEDPDRRLMEDLFRFKQQTECGEVATTRGQPAGRPRAGRRVRTRLGVEAVEELTVRRRPEAAT